LQVFERKGDMQEHDFKFAHPLEQKVYCTINVSTACE